MHDFSLQRNFYECIFYNMQAINFKMPSKQTRKIIHDLPSLKKWIQDKVKEKMTENVLIAFVDAFLVCLID